MFLGRSFKYQMTISILFRAFQKTGLRGVLLHFRCAGQEPNRLPRTYHAGDTEDLNTFIQLLNTREPNTKKAVVGISLGGNVLLKWLGEHSEHAAIDRAVAVSVPFDLENLVYKLNTGVSKLYQKHLIKKLRQLYAKKRDQFLPFHIEDLNTLHTFSEFDEVTTAPLHGFSSAHEYYRLSSCISYLPQIQKPTLIIHAQDDPFMTPDCLPTEEHLSRSTILELSHHGGHVGFIAQNKYLQPEFWLGHRVSQFLQDLIP